MEESCEYNQKQSKRKEIMNQINKQHELTINISPQSRNNIITNTTFFSMDVKTAKKVINFTHENSPVNRKC